MGLAMGTSEAVGYVNAEGNILGWFNELAFAPVDLSESAMQDEWSATMALAASILAGCGDQAGSCCGDYTFGHADACGEAQGSAKTYFLKDWAAAGESIAASGVYLAHALALYDQFYEIRHLLLLGRVVSGEGGKR